MLFLLYVFSLLMLWVVCRLSAGMAQKCSPEKEKIQLRLADFVTSGPDGKQLNWNSWIAIELLGDLLNWQKP
jgi:hypothetical protein